MPYPLLLQKSAREALDISLKGHVVIIDEAHNLMDAVSSINSIAITLAQLRKSHKQLEIYFTKFRNKLKGKNKVYIMQLIKSLDGLAIHLEGLPAGEGTVLAGDLLAAKGIDQINMFKLQRYITESKLARKVEGYLDFEEKKHQKENKLTAHETKSIPTLIHLQSFLLTLTNPSAEGKVFYGKTENEEPYFKYMLLDPAFHFRTIVEEARAVILAGGTMEPVRTSNFAHIPGIY